MRSDEDQPQPGSGPEDRLDDSIELRTAVLSERIADRAMVLVGEELEPWDFPMEMLPERIEVGTYLLVEMLGGRPVSVRLHREHELVARKGMESRLARLARYEHLTGTEVRVG
jgi:hypothetical protein